MATRLKFEVFDVYDRMESKVGGVVTPMWHCSSCCHFLHCRCARLARRSAK